MQTSTDFGYAAEATHDGPTKPSVVTMVERLAKAQAAADDVVNMLADRLAPVTSPARPARPADDGAELAVARQTCSPLAETLDSAVARLNDLTGRMRELIERIEL